MGFVIEGAVLEIGAPLLTLTRLCFSLTLTWMSLRSTRSLSP